MTKNKTAKCIVCHENKATNQISGVIPVCKNRECMGIALRMPFNYIREDMYTKRLLVYLKMEMKKSEYALFISRMHTLENEYPYVLQVRQVNKISPGIYSIKSGDSIYIISGHSIYLLYGNAPSRKVLTLYRKGDSISLLSERLQASSEYFLEPFLLALDKRRSIVKYIKNFVSASKPTLFKLGKIVEYSSKRFRIVRVSKDGLNGDLENVETKQLLENVYLFPNGIPLRIVLKEKVKYKY